MFLLNTLHWLDAKCQELKFYPICELVSQSAIVPWMLGEHRMSGSETKDSVILTKPETARRSYIFLVPAPLAPIPTGRSEKARATAPAGAVLQVGSLQSSQHKFYNEQWARGHLLGGEHYFDDTKQYKGTTSIFQDCWLLNVLEKIIYNKGASAHKMYRNEGELWRNFPP